MNRSVSTALLALMTLATVYAATSSDAFAGDMKDCIRLVSESDPARQGKTRKVLVNNCAVRTYVFWCHRGGTAYPCKPPKHFRQGRHFSPGERYVNSYTVPDNVDIDLGACTGLYTRIEFGPDGSYRCPSDGSGIEGQGPRRGRAQCADGRNIDFDWQLKGENERVAVLQLQDGAVQIPREEYRAFERKPDGQPPALLVRRLCSGFPGTMPEAGAVPQMKGKLRQHADEIERENRQRCAAKSNEGDDCRRYLEPQRVPQAGGPRG